MTTERMRVLGMLIGSAPTVAGCFDLTVAPPRRRHQFFFTLDATAAGRTSLRQAGWRIIHYVHILRRVGPSGKLLGLWRVFNAQESSH